MNITMDNQAFVIANQYAIAPQPAGKYEPIKKDPENSVMFFGNYRDRTRVYVRYNPQELEAPK